MLQACFCIQRGSRQGGSPSAAQRPAAGPCRAVRTARCPEDRPQSAHLLRDCPPRPRSLLPGGRRRGQRAVRSFVLWSSLLVCFSLVGSEANADGKMCLSAGLKFVFLTWFQVLSAILPAPACSAPTASGHLSRWLVASLQLQQGLRVGEALTAPSSPLGLRRLRRGCALPELVWDPPLPGGGNTRAQHPATLPTCRAWRDCRF